MGRATSIILGEHFDTLIAQQNKMISYINGLGIAVSTSDKQLMQKIKGIR